jgi:hypothetical protein
MFTNLVNTKGTTKGITTKNITLKNKSSKSTNQFETTTDCISAFIRQSLYIYPLGMNSPPDKHLIVNSDNIISKTMDTVVRRIEYETQYISDSGDIKVYKLYGILKYNSTFVVDNLFYEYMVGVCCINRLTNKFPVFVYTYGIYALNKDIIKLLRKNKDISGDILIQNLKSLSLDSYEDSCKNYTKLCLCLQYCPNMTIMLSNALRLLNYKIELGLILFQIYFALSQCRNVFTHYDLHDDNVGVIQLPNKMCIKYMYEFVDNKGHKHQVCFKSRYIVKIFDYGRSYFSGITPTGEYITSAMFIDTIKSIRKCQPTEKYGFNTRLPKYFIDPSVLNNSHDLRLLYLLSNTLYKIPELADIPLYLKYDSLYGTSPMKSSNSKYIYTITDALHVLFDGINRINPTTHLSIVSASNKQYEKNTCIGTIHVWGLYKDMTFIPEQCINDWYVN